ncbi:MULTISPECIES: TonB-dependent receptor family protein [Pseudomonadaceae]|uniref:TonB-dependent receptor n=1 Tax=Pseudomonas denitrificans TaxID=43306 RepID=A0A9X7R491_PSEDE|nr:MULTISPECIES: TonB-dependent receptor [Pseudomonadaceae]MBD9630012.1 TonB-dependent receptor [Pseudomonas sp. PDM19]QEY72054.1 TonB-dependent receptor [Pseudomonas denitrificans (nom. rej.)]
MSRCLSPKRHFPSKLSFPLLALGLLPLAAVAEDRLELEPMQISEKSPAPVSVSAQAERQRLDRVPGGTNLVEPQRETRLATLRDALDYQPGLVIQDFFGGTDQPRLNIRGSGIQSNPVNRGVLLLQDGLPLNEADGSFIIGLLEPRNASWISARRGANAGSPGATALGGELEFNSLTGADEAGRVRLEAGSFGRQGLQAAAGLDGGGHDARVSISHDEYDGYRHHSASHRTVVQSNFGLDLGNGVQNRSYLSYSDLTFEIPNVITKARLKDDPRSVLGDGNTAQDRLLNVYKRDPHRDTQQLRLANRTQWSGAGWQQSFGIYGQNTQDDFTDPLSHTLTDSDTLGAQWQLEGEQRLFDYRLGVSWAYSDMTRELYANNPQNGSRMQRFGNFDLEASNLDLLLGLDWHLAPDWTLVTEVKWSDVRRDADSRDGAGHLDQGWNFATPKIGLNWTPSPDLRWYANISRSHEAPTFWEIVSAEVSPAAPAAAQAQLVNLDVQRATTYEIGGTGRIAQTDWSLTLYQSDVEDELISTSDAYGVKVGTYNYGSRTRHRGVEAGINGMLPTAASIGGDLAYRVAWTFSDFRFRGGEFQGNQIAGVPRQLWSAELLYRRGPWSIGPNLRWLPQDTPTDHANTRNNYQDSYALWGLKASYKAREGLSVYVQGDNLADKTYASSYVIRNRADASQPTFLSGNGRSLSVGAEYAF